MFDVQQGKYSLIAEAHYMQQSYGKRSPNSDFAAAVIAGPGLSTDHLVFRWFPPAAISGRVIDQFGEPVEAAHVGLLRMVVLNGRKRVYFYGSRYTNDRGEYYIGPFLPGSYYVTVAAAPWYAGSALAFAVSANRALASSPAYATMYYPNTHDPRAAAPLVIKPGQEARADFTLDKTRGVNLTIHSEGART